MPRPGQVRFQQGFFTVARTCPQCRGTGQMITKPCQTRRGAGQMSHDRKLTVKIPAGIADGQQLRLQSEGEAGSAGGPAGNLYVVVHVHSEFFLSMVSIVLRVPSIHALALGGEIVGDAEAGQRESARGQETGTTAAARRVCGCCGRGRGTARYVQCRRRKLTRTRHLGSSSRSVPEGKIEPRRRRQQDYAPFVA